MRDAKALMQVHREAVFAEATGHYSRAMLDAWHREPRPRVARVEQEIAHPAFIVLVAKTAGDLIGFAMALPSKGELHAIYVKLVGWVKAKRNQSDVAEPR
jgi:hypothetical protein